MHPSVESNPVKDFSQWYKRKMIVLHQQTPKPISILTYNILAKKFVKGNQYEHCPEWAKEWYYRRELLIKELRHYNPNVVCLQEVQKCDYDSFLLPTLESYGYVGDSEMKEEGRFQDGLAIFYKKNDFAHIGREKGLAQFLMVKKVTKSSSLSQNQTWDYRQTITEVERLKEYNLVLEGRLADNSRQERLETKFAEFRAESDRALLDAQQEIRRSKMQLQGRNTAMREMEIANTRLNEGLQDAKTEKNRAEGQASALLGLLGNLRKLYLELEKESQCFSFIDRVRSDETIVSKGTMLEHGVTTLKDNLKEFSFALNKIVVESGRIEPPVLGAGSADPRNILLQQWHPEAIRLRRELAEWQSRVPRLVHD